MNNNLPAVNVNGQLIPNMNFNPNLEAYSEYFNYGYNPFTWNYKVEEFKEKIREIRKKLTEEEYKRDFINEYNLEESTNENFYLWNLPLELGGIGDYLKNTYYLNFFNTNKRGVENIPPIEYNKFNSHYVNLPSLERGTIEKREKEEAKHSNANLNANLNLNTKQETIGEKERVCKPTSPVSVSMKDKLNNTNFYLKNNNSFNMKNDTNFHYNYSLPNTIENKPGKFIKVDTKSNVKDKNEKVEKMENKLNLDSKLNDTISENSISSSESRNNKKRDKDKDKIKDKDKERERANYDKNGVKDLKIKKYTEDRNKDSRDNRERKERDGAYRSPSNSDKHKKRDYKDYKNRDEHKKDAKRGINLM